VSNFEYSLGIIFNQEVRNCHLIRYKFVDSKNPFLSILQDDQEIRKQWENQKSFTEFKKSFFEILYSRYILLKESPLFDNWLYAMYRSTLSDLLNEHENTTPTIDEGLRTLPYTAAFKASHLLLSEIFPFDRKGYKEVLVSEFIENSLYDACSPHYPIKIDRLLKQLKIKDPDFWEIIWRVMRQTASIAVAYNLKTRGKILLQKDKAHEPEDWIGKLSGKTYDVLSGKISEDETSTITDGERLWEFIRSTSINALRNEFKKLNRSEENILLPVDEQSGRNPYNLPVIDTDDLDDLRRVLLEILYKETPVVYEELINGLDKEGLTLLRYQAEGYSYDEIIEKIHGSGYPKDKRKTENERLRKCLGRTRIELISRLKKLYMI